jgi:hypothetical protein
MAPLGWALAAAGHEVRVACSSKLAPTVARSGLTAVPVAAELDMLLVHRLRALREDGQLPGGTREVPLLDPGTGAPLSGPFASREFRTGRWRRHLQSLERGIDNVTEYARRWRPELVLSDPLSVEAVLAADALGVPAVWHLWGPAGPEEIRADLEVVTEDPLGDCNRYPLEKVPDLVDAVLDVCPAELAPPVPGTRLSMRHVPYNGPAVEPGWLAVPPDRPRIAVAWGNSVTDTYGPASFLVPEVLAALAGLDVEVVVSVNGADRGRIGPVPDNATVHENLPLNLLLPTCALVVHHGGAGCLMSALDVAVPQLLLTFSVEQDANGRRLAATGAGRHLPGRQTDVAAVRSAVEAMLATPRYAAAADRLRADLHTRPAPADVVPHLLALAPTAG